MQKNLTTIKTILLAFLLVLLVCCLTITLALTNQQNVAQAVGVISVEELPQEESSDDYPIMTIADVGDSDSFIRQWNAGGEIKLSTDVTVETSLSSLTLGKSVTIDLNDHVLDLGSYVINVTGGTLTIKDSAASSGTNHTVSRVGGGTVTIKGGVLTTNSTSTCIYVSNSGVLNLQSGTIAGCSRAISLSPGTLEMTGGAISYNRTVAENTDAGAIFANYNSTINISDGTISYNESTRNGGAINLAAGTLTMTGGIISNNRAQFAGGGVYVWTGNGNNSVELSGGAQIINNEGTYGGGIYLLSNGSSELKIDNATISGNTATAGDGGGILVGSNNTLTMTNGTISNNRANDGYGGGVQVAGTFVMTGGVIILNTSIWGGGVRVSNIGYFNMQGGTISDNTATQNGGGVNTNSTFEMSGGEIINNNAIGSGGGVRTADMATFKMSGGTISGNRASAEGGVYIHSMAGVEFSGRPVIKDNIRTTDYSASNLELNNKLLTIAGRFEEGAEVYVRNSTTYLFANNVTQQDAAKYFYADDETQCIGYSNGNLVLSNHSLDLQHNTEGHKYECANCKVVEDEETHDWNTIAYVADDNGTTHHRECPVCNETQSSVAHIVTIATKTDDSNHTGYCDDCKAQVSVSHTITDNFNDESNHDLNGHWQTCSICNSRVNEATHEWGADWKDADDYHLQTCEICTQEYRQAHTFSSWTTAGETDHTRKCEDCQREETLAHVVGEVFYNDGEGNHYKKCKDCDAEIEKQSHNYNGKYYDDGKGNHYQICEDCNYTTEYTPHNVTSWSSNGSETHQGQCETCQLTVVASHDWEDTKTFDDYGHWYKCNAQGCEAKNDYHEHVVSTWTSAGDDSHKGNCTDCDKQDITALHTLGKLQQDDEGYYQECTVCKYKVEYSDVGENHEHDYSELCYDEVSHWYRCECGALQNVKPHDNSEWKFEGKNHYKYCETCKQKYLDEEHSLIKHTGYEETCKDTGLKDYWECRICNSYFSDEGVTRITMDINTWLEREEQSGGGIIPSNSAKHQYDQVNFKSNETGHWYECTVCGEKLGSIANHVDVDDWTDNGDGRHYKTCQYCNYVTKYESHNGANWHTDGNQTHTGTCLDCGATVTQSHDWNNTFTYDEYTHWYACKATGCTERKAETAHVGNKWQNVGNSSYHEGICDCGYAHVKQNHTLTWETYQDSYRQECKICGYADDSSVTDHVFTNWEYLNEDEHQSHCDIPNHEDVQTAAHVWETKYDQTSHWQVCKDCGYEKDNSRTTHVLTSGTQNQDETHTGTCTVCGAEGIRQDHVWSEDWVVGEDSHWRECTICAAHIDESAHNVTEFTTDGEHTHSGSCTVCGKHFEREHTWLFGFCTECPDQLKNYSEADIGIAATAIVAQLFALIAVAAIISRRIKR